MSISDDGQGVPATQIERVFFAVRPRVNALSLLRRRLQGLFGRSFKLEVHSDIGRGTTVTMRIPLRQRSDLAQNRGEYQRSFTASRAAS
jgi:LytS/YehU family sensor histidine kinase